MGQPKRRTRPAVIGRFRIRALQPTHAHRAPSICPRDSTTSLDLLTAETLMNHDLLESLYAARRALTDLIVSTGSATIPNDALQMLIWQRDQIVATINRVLVADLSSAVADVAYVCKLIDTSTNALKGLSATADDVGKAVGIVNDILGVAGKLIK
jgi:hypothetical protein